MPQWWESAPLAEGRPSSDWWSAAPVVKPAPRSARPIPPGTEARDLGLEFEQDEVDAAARAGASGLVAMGTPALGGPVGRFLGTSVGMGVTTAAEEMLRGDDWQSAALKGVAATAAGKYVPGMFKSLTARLSHRLARVAKQGATATAEAAEPAVERAFRGVPSTMKVGAVDDAATMANAARASEGARAATSIGRAAPSGRVAARPVAPTAAPAPSTPKAPPMSAAERAAYEAESEARLAAAEKAWMGQTPAAPAKASTLPVKGNVKPATVFTRPKDAPPSRSEAARTLASSGKRELKAKQAQLSQSTGQDIAEAFGTKLADAGESAIETRLRASVLLQKDPKALANEIEARVLGMGNVSPADAARAIEELYGLPRAATDDMVSLIYRQHGIAR